MKKTIIFDYTGILTEESNMSKIGEKLAKKYNANVEQFLILLKENWKKARINEMSSILFWENLAAYLKINSKQFRKEFIDFFKLDKKALEFIKKLKASYKLGLLSNQLEDWLEEDIVKYKLSKVFDVIVTSYQVKKAKPEIEIYNVILKKLEVSASECIFIDDLERNLIPAKELGMQVVLFKDLVQLKKDLKDLKF